MLIPTKCRLIKMATIVQVYKPFLYGNYSYVWDVHLLASIKRLGDKRRETVNIRFQDRQIGRRTRENPSCRSVRLRPLSHAEQRNNGVLSASVFGIDGNKAFL